MFTMFINRGVCICANWAYVLPKSVAEASTSFPDVERRTFVATKLLVVQVNLRSNLNWPPGMSRCPRSIDMGVGYAARSVTRERPWCSSLVLTHRPQNAQVRDIMTRKFALLKSDPDTKNIFQSVCILCAYRRNNNLRGTLVKSSLWTTGPVDRESGKLPCNRPRCVTCAHTNASRTLDSLGGQLHEIRAHWFTCATSNLVYVIS